MNKKAYKIAVIGGDGTGPEVIREGVKVLNAVAGKFNFKLEWTYFDFGGEHYLKTGEVLPPSAVDDLKKFDAIYLGAIGHPDVKPGILEKGILLKLRFELDQYINLRPVKLFPGVETPLKNKGPDGKYKYESAYIDVIWFNDLKVLKHTYAAQPQAQNTAQPEPQTTGFDWDEDLSNGIHSPTFMGRSTKFKFCPMCGRKL